MTAALIAVQVLYAVPAKRGPFKVVQPDGSQITLYNNGDETCHFLTNETGEIVIQNEQGEYIVAGDQQAKAITKRMQASRRQYRKHNDVANQHGLVILANFADLEFLPENTPEALEEMLNGSNYSYNGATGSARKYFQDQSSGAYNPVFDIVGPVTLPQNLAYYGMNDRVGKEPQAHIAIIDACRLADSLLNIDFSQYDNDNDGYVDFIYLIYAGHNEAEGASTLTIWPHTWNLLDLGVDINIDGKQLGTYACTSELRGSYGKERAGIGTFCHEFGHILGFPDLYPTVNNAKHKTLDTWDIMDYGAYNNNGHTPPAYSAYERFFFGWTKPLILNTPNHYYIKDIQTTNACGIITQDGTSDLDGSQPQPNVFYLVENRQNNGWDTYLPGHGLMITKIQYNPDNWYNNTVNNSPDNMGIDIIEAAPATGIKAQASDLYPAGNNMCVPYTFYPLLNIEEDSQGIITFQFMNGGDDAPVEITDQQTTGIDNIPSHDNDSEIVAIHTITGQNTGIKDITRLTQGIYIITTKNKNANSTLQTKKIYVKKI